MKAIVGLGNPGREVRGHAAQRRVRGASTSWRGARRVEFESAPAEALIARVAAAGSASVLLAKPLTFMNLSGQAVGELLRYFKIEVGRPAGRRRRSAAAARAGCGRGRAGSAGGHNGLKSIIAHLGDEFARLRIGVGRGDARRDLADHVLSRFDTDEAAEVERMIARAADAAEMFVTGGDRGGDEPVQRRRSGDNRIADAFDGAPCHRMVAVALRSDAVAGRRSATAVQKEQHMADRQYELVYILPPDTTEQQVAELHDADRSRSCRA